MSFEDTNDTIALFGWLDLEEVNLYLPQGSAPASPLPLLVAVDRVGGMDQGLAQSKYSQ